MLPALAAVATVVLRRAAGCSSPAVAPPPDAVPPHQNATADIPAQVFVAAFQGQGPCPAGQARFRLDPLELGRHHSLILYFQPPGPTFVLCRCTGCSAPSGTRDAVRVAAHRRRLRRGRATRADAHRRAGRREAGMTQRPMRPPRAAGAPGSATRTARGLRRRQCLALLPAWVTAPLPSFAAGTAQLDPATWARLQPLVRPALVHMRSRRWLQAAGLLEQARRIVDEQPANWRWRCYALPPYGVVLLELGQVDSAIAVLLQAREAEQRVAAGEGDLRLRTIEKLLTEGFSRMLVETEFKRQFLEPVSIAGEPRAHALQNLLLDGRLGAHQSLLPLARAFARTERHDAVTALYLGPPLCLQTAQRSTPTTMPCRRLRPSARNTSASRSACCWPAAVTPITRHARWTKRWNSTGAASVCKVAGRRR
ncbi:MAG: hypothetical protein MZW92_57290 [Comamonadaceae bacterium]|nr:hypothetical protein [Comamonadaceae bacterium]